jgi:diguanylate cyclase (GGDEF)-like protein
MPSSFTVSLREALRASFSPFAAKILSVITNPKADAQEAANAIRVDPALTGAVLALANSPAYGQLQKVYDIQRAVVILGQQEILRLALAVSLYRSLGVVLLEHGFEPHLVWRSILWAALSAEAMAMHAFPDKAQAAYLATLLKDIAVLILAAAGQLPSTVPQDLIGSGLPPDIEHHHLSADLLAGWNIPDDITHAVLHHHDLAGVMNHPPVTQLTILATAWAEAEFATTPDPNFLGQVHFLIKHILGISSATLQTLRQSIGERLNAMCSTLQVDCQKAWSFHSYPVDDIADFLAQVREIESITDGIHAVATAIGRHVRWNWQCRTGEVILRDPESRSWLRFDLTQDKTPLLERGNLLATMTMPPGLTPILVADHEPLGELRISQEDCGQHTKSVHLYARLLATSLRRYLTHQAPQRTKALVLDNLPVGVALLDASGHLQTANPAFRTYLQTPASEETTLEKLLGILPITPNSIPWRRFLEDKQARSQTWAFCPLELRQPHAPGLTVSLCRLPETPQTPERILLLVQDLMAVHYPDFDAMEQRDFLSGLLRAMPDIVMTVDKAGTIGFVSKPYAHALVGRNIHELGTSMNPLDPQWNLDQLLKESIPVEIRTALDGREVILELLGTAQPSDRFYAVIVGRDMTAVRRLERAIKEQALLDALTRVFNRHHLASILEREMERARRTDKTLGVLFFDVDKFKQYNDRHGHSAGDALLTSIGAILRETLRKGMDYPFRFGGDEFLVLCADASPQGLSALARRIQERLAKSTQECTLSIGGTILGPEDTVDSLINRADQANYHAKQGGGNRFVYLAPPERSLP